MTGKFIDLTAMTQIEIFDLTYLFLASQKNVEHGFKQSFDMTANLLSAIQSEQGAKHNEKER